MEDKPKFRATGTITVDQEVIDLSKLGEGECYEIMDGDSRIGYLCKVGDQYRVFKEGEIIIKE
ncbi:MAG: hypothetical protein DRO39_05040 [Thermoprotei archaeon]|nr:MAG: hypothetical protein DRO39_05040 [Thermoprotei archaeon]